MLNLVLLPHGQRESFENNTAPYMGIEAQLSVRKFYSSISDEIVPNFYYKIMFKSHKITVLLICPVDIVFAK